MPEVGNKPKNLVKNRSPQGHFEGQNSSPLNVGGIEMQKMAPVYLPIFIILSPDRKKACFKKATSGHTDENAIVIFGVLL